MNKTALLFLLVVLLSSCNSTQNWKSTQTEDHWAGSFGHFKGQEHLDFKKQPGKLLYVSAQAKCISGSLSLQQGKEVVAVSETIIHQKFNLEHNIRLTITGKNAQGSFYLAYPVYSNKRVNVNFNANTELLSLCYFLTIYNDIASIPETQYFEIDGKQVKVKDLYALNLKVANEFIPFLQSENLAVIKSYFDRDFYLHYTNFILSLDNFPNALVDSKTEFVQKFETTDDAQTFVNALNAFYKEIDFGAFLNRYKPYYAEMISEVTENLPKEDFITEMEHFYGQSMAGYNLYPSLTMPFSSGFAVGNKGMTGNIFGSFNPPGEINNTSALHLGFENSISLRSLSVHEFGHSFVNPAVDKVNETTLKATEALFEPIKDKMYQQGYNQWKICVYEHFVRAGEVIIAKLIGDTARAQEILNDNVANRSFIYLPQIVEKLEYWYYNEYFTKTYAQKVNEILSELKPKP